MVHFLILAAGKGERAKKVSNNSPKQYIEFNNISPLRYLLKKITKIKEISSFEGCSFLPSSHLLFSAL